MTLLELMRKPTAEKRDLINVRYFKHQCTLASSIVAEVNEKSKFKIQKKYHPMLEEKDLHRRVIIIGQTRKDYEINHTETAGYVTKFTTAIKFVFEDEFKDTEEIIKDIQEQLAKIKYDLHNAEENTHKIERVIGYTSKKMEFYRNNYKRSLKEHLEIILKEHKSFIEKSRNSLNAANSTLNTISHIQKELQK